MAGSVPPAGSIPPAAVVGAAQVRSFRVAAQQLDRTPASRTTDLDECVVFDLGVQDTGTDGAAWSLANRGFRLASSEPEPTALVWTLRGAPHLYRRDDLDAVRRGTAPLSEADAAFRVHAAAKPLRDAGITVLDALERLTDELRRLVTAPTGKGEVSGALAQVLEQPYLLDCPGCRATHPYELPFRLAMLKAGLELVPGTSPPELRPLDPAPIPGNRDLDALRQCLRLLGPATPAQVAGFLDAPPAEVRRHWPEDTVPVDVDGERRSILADQLDDLREVPMAHGTKLLDAYDPFLQARERELLVADKTRRSRLWSALGRPGAVLHDGAVVGTWRPRASSRSLRVLVELWDDIPAVRTGIDEQAGRLAEFRGARLKAVEVS